MHIAFSIPRTTPTSGRRPSSIESLWIAALLTCFATDGEVRARARVVFVSAARSFVWGVLAGQTTASVSPSYLTRTTAQATAQFLRLWPDQHHPSTDAMLDSLGAIVRAVTYRGVSMPPAVRVAPSTLGVLTPLSRAERSLLVQIVQGDLQPDDIVLLAFATEHAPDVYVEAPAHQVNLADAVRRMEAALLGAARYELGTSIYEPITADAA